jgi:GWxTD domain-containing protein
MRISHLVIGSVALGLFAGAGTSRAAQQKQDAASPQQETIAKPLTEKQKRKQEERLKKELMTPYKKWLDEDVTYIITEEERRAFKGLKTDEERENFIEQFWLRRDPTPDTEENEFKEEHYRRIAYANEHYASGIPGWKTDRGRMYITFGPPDDIESHSSGGAYQRPIEEGGGETSTYPFEDWNYRYIEGVGSNIKIEFVDPTMSGEYHMTMDPSEKDALLMVPNAGLTLFEQMGLSNKTARFNNTDGTHDAYSPFANSENMNEFTRLEQFAKLQQAPKVKYKDLEAIVNTKITYNILPLKVRADFIPLTESTTLANITVQLENKDLQFEDKNGVSKAAVNMFGRITSMSRRVVNTFEEPVTVEAPTAMLEAQTRRQSLYQKSVPLAPGMYRLNVVVKDMVGGNMNNYELAMHVPHLEEEKLASSSVILADLIEKMPSRSVGMGQFVIGDYKVRPRVNDTFRREEKLGIYTQLYNFAADATTKKPNGTVEYEVVKNGTNQKVLDYTEEIGSMQGVSQRRVTIEKILPLKDLAPGQYTLRLKVVDRTNNQTLTPAATFTVTQ